MTRLETLIGELMMHALDPCDLGDGIEVIHDVEAIEIEMDCDVEEDPAAEPHRWFDEVFAGAIKRGREPAAAPTHRFVHESTPYERIEIV